MAKKQSKKPRHRRGNRHWSSALTLQVIAAVLAVLIGGSWWYGNEEEVGYAGTCAMVMAESAFPGGGWGVFSLRSIDSGKDVTYGESVFQLTDIPVELKEDLSFLLQNYVWNGKAGGGGFEGRKVYSVIPGLGSLANSNSDLINVGAKLPQVDHGGLRRNDSPGAGASSNYHNLVYRAKNSRSIDAGDELIVDYGVGWKGNMPGQQLEDGVVPRRDVQELKDTGYCLDNIRPARSTNTEAGRGAFATRNLKKGTVVSPVPLIPINNRRVLVVDKQSATNNTRSPQKQLLLNYCFGHKKSSLLFFPYAPIANLINHDSKKMNVKLRWSESHLHAGREWLNYPLEQVKNMKKSGLLLEFVANRDIEAGEEIFLDYGQEWENAWSEHKANWKSVPGADEYVYPYELEEQLRGKHLPTEEDSDFPPYPDSVQTGCLYHYGERAWEAASGAARIQWKLTRNSAVVTNLRRCRLISKQVDSYGMATYTAEMLNLHEKESDNIPASETHIVFGIPREAIVLRDKMYESDQHLVNAFRHEMGIPTEIFPEQWMDLE